MLKFKSDIFMFIFWVVVAVVTQSVGNIVVLLIWSFLLLLTPLNNMKCAAVTAVLFVPTIFLVRW